MKKIIFLIAVLISSATIYAQQSGTKAKAKAEKRKPLTTEERAVKITNRLTKELTLTPEQTPKVKQSTLTRLNQIEASRSKAGADKKAFGQERKKILQNWEAEMKGILTNDQFTTYLAKKEEKKKKRAEKKGSTTIEDADDSDEIDE